MAVDADAQDSLPPTLKPQLDQAAVDQREREHTPKPNPVVQKITECFPPASKMLGPKDDKAHEQAHPPGPPDRPEHDAKIERFVRDQHRSKQPGGDLVEVAQDGGS
ncbi:uncharacterized protein UV8b_06901 [Ustilaginoidea virens]|uniref:Uncharacterized protein n=1 Tax=Ustilaginoidea virens TaxID=1159556 RepID=A0A8E5HW07_USTVR|nr:uncharacterized protein UV8b_06901 [Ustilaginoidea virens]QUC22660.1 hypothetical protein UV8b_06901 [Ustilaginoidea virens]